MSNTPRHTMPPYGTAIQSAISAGDLPQMKTLLKQREVSATEPKELKAAYEELSAVVARLEKH
ncbi:DUF1843 domain-containing protein [Pseudomonas purpurea]|uniref:DUF1843 domain-containing protein n=1 Tax=Pseudomonas purpurea TaxID=3136737 RepID=UPI0032678473